MNIEALDPNRFIKFQSDLRSKRVASILGISLGVSFFICFLTGLYSHLQQHPVSYIPIYPHPGWFYRVTQGLHIATGLASIPLLLAKLWNVFPNLLKFPPIESVAEALERISIFPLIGGAFFQLITGVANINEWYFFPFFFTKAHYAVAWITIGAMIVHIGAKATIVSTALASQKETETPLEVAQRVTRRRFLYGIFGTAGLVTFFSVGESFSPLGRTALLAPRKPGIGPQGLPVNKSAEGAGVIKEATSADYRLKVSGRGIDTPLSLSLADLQAMVHNEASLPITCVEGWSAGAHWKGVSVRDLVKLAGAPSHVSVQVKSIEQHGLYGQSVLNPDYVSDPDTLLALELNGGPLDIQHGFPCRLIAPNRPGVLQTKWVNELVVL